MSPFSLGILSSAHVPAAGGGPLLEFTDSAVNPTDGSTQTYSGIDFGTAHADRHVVVALAWGSISRMLDSATIGGVSATIDQVSPVGVGQVAILRALVPSGASGDVVLTYVGSVARSMIGVYASLVDIAVSATATLSDGGSGPASASLTNPAGGHVIASAYTHTTPISWAGGVTSDYVASTETVYGGAASTTTPGTLVITAGGTTNDAIAAVAYQGA